MALTKDDLRVILGQVSAMLNERPAPIGIAAHTVPGSWNAEDGTMVASVDDSDAASQLAIALGDPEITTILSHPRVPVMTHDPNDQYGPRGGEPVMLHHTQRGFAAKFIPDAGGNVAPGYGPFFSVQAPAGERWITHRNAAGEIDAYLKHTNDGPTEGDGLGGSYLGNGAIAQIQTANGFKASVNDTAKTAQIETPAGRVITANDEAKTITVVSPTGHSVTVDDNPETTGITVETANGLIGHFDDVLQQIKAIAAGTLTSPTLYTLLDGAGNAISHVASSVALGALEGAPSLVPSISKTDMTELIGDTSVGINIQRWVDLVFTMKALLLAMSMSGVPSLPTLAAVITEMSSVFGTSVPSFGSLPGWSAIQVPSGSSVVSLLPT